MLATIVCMAQARYTTRWGTANKFNPDYVIADPAYSSRKLNHVIRGQYWAKPIILPNPSHKKLTANTERTSEWKMLYNRRTSVERLIGRLKPHRRLESVRVRGKRKVRNHALLSIIVCQAQALATCSCVSVRKIA